MQRRSCRRTSLKLGEAGLVGGAEPEWTSKTPPTRAPRANAATDSGGEQRVQTETQRSRRPEPGIYSDDDDDNSFRDYVVDHFFLKKSYKLALLLSLVFTSCLVYPHFLKILTWFVSRGSFLKHNKQEQQWGCFGGGWCMHHGSLLPGVISSFAV